MACAASVSGQPSDLAARRARRAAVEGLVRSTAPVDAGELLGYLDDEDPYVRGAAAEALGRRKTPGAFDALAKAVESGGDQNTRWGAVDGLAALGDPRAVPVLISCLKHADKITRWKAVVALGKLGDVRAVTALIAVRGDAYAPVKNAADEALAAIGGRDSAPRKVKR